MVEAKKGIGISMRKYRTLIVFLGIFVVLVGAYFLMKHVNKDQAEKEQDETIMMTELGDLAAMEYTDGETTLSFIKEEDTWTVTGNEELVLDNDSVETIADTLGQIEAMRVLEGEEELSSYGLVEPAYTISLKTTSGAEVTIYIGNEAEGNYYATTDDKMVVYVINSSAVDALEFDVTALEAEVAEDGEETTEE